MNRFNGFGVNGGTILDTPRNKARWPKKYPKNEATIKGSGEYCVYCHQEVAKYDRDEREEGDDGKVWHRNCKKKRQAKNAILK